MKKTMILFFVFAAYLAFWSGSVFGEDFCVSDETGFQDALWTANGNDEDDTIKVEQGTYIGNFFYHTGETKHITILGGYNSGCNDRVLDPTNTILDGGESDRVLRVYTPFTGANITVEGFTIQNGNSVNPGGGIYAYTSADTTGGTITIKNNIVIDNTGPSTGGIFAFNSGSGGGTTGDIIITDNIVKRNTSTTGGGGVSATADADSGDAGNVTLVNNVIADNTAQSTNGGGVRAESNSISGTPGDVTLTNNTITGNSADDYGGGIEINRQGGTINVYNNIISGNTAYSNYYDIYLSSSGGTANGFNNNYDLDTGGMNSAWDNYGGNIDVDPLFANPGAGNYRLKPRSLCIDAGETVAPQIPNFDIEGNDRIIDGDRDGTEIVDMGAYEYVPRSLISHILLLLSQ